MPNERYEDVPFLSEEAGVSEKDGASTGSIRHQRRQWFTGRPTPAVLVSIFLAVILIITVIAVPTQHIVTKQKTAHSTPNPQAPQDFDLPQEASLTPSKDNPDLYDFPRLGNVALKTPGCGTTPSEAKALGCVFDPMSWQWTRPECFYKEWSDYAQSKHGPWPYYKDANHTEPLILPDAEAMSTERLVYSIHSWHVEHCVYVLKHLHRAAMLDKWIPEETASWPHTLHCMEMIEMMGTPPQTLNTRIEMQFLACVKFESNSE
ncbi:MAG: hypothetical protein Q9165_007381 [Trypethelium subeluteriae]